MYSLQHIKVDTFVLKSPLEQWIFSQFANLLDLLLSGRICSICIYGRQHIELIISTSYSVVLDAIFEPKYTARCVLDYTYLNLNVVFIIKLYIHYTACWIIKKDIISMICLTTRGIV